MRRFVISPIVLGVVGAFSARSLAAERLVPSEYPTIQAAIDAADEGDEVIIAPGTYTGDGNRDIDLLGKAITLHSLDPNDPDVVAVARYVLMARGDHRWVALGEGAHSPVTAAPVGGSQEHKGAILHSTRLKRAQNVPPDGSINPPVGAWIHGIGPLLRGEER